MASLLSLLGLQPDQAPMQASSMGATSMAQGQTMQQPKGLLGLGGNLGGFLDFQDPQKLIALQLINNGQKAPGQMFDGVPELAAYGAKVGQQKLEREQAQQAKNATTEFLKTNDPGLANLVAQGALTPAQAYSQYAQKQRDAQEEQTWRNRLEYQTQLERNDPKYQLGMQLTQAQIDAEKVRTDPYSERKAQAEAAGLQPTNPAYQSFVLTGKMPREDAQSLTATDKKAILEADEMVSNAEGTLPLIKRALELNSKAYDGAGAGARGWLAGNVGIDSGEATMELNNVVTAQALGQLKAIFGGAPTEGERKILLDVEGSVNLPANVREGIYKRAEAAVERRLKLYKDRADSLRGGTFYGNAPSAAGGQATQPQTQQAPAQPSVDDLLKKYGTP